MIEMNKKDVAEQAKAEQSSRAQYGLVDTIETDQLKEIRERETRRQNGTQDF